MREENEERREKENGGLLASKPILPY